MAIFYPPPPPFVGGQQPHAPKPLPASIEAVPVDEPPHQHPARSPALSAIVRAWDPPPPNAFLGGRQPLQPLLPSELFPPGPSNPPFSHPARTAALQSLLRAWDPPPPDPRFDGRQALSPRRLAPAIIAVPVSDPPFRHPARTAALQAIMRAWDPPPPNAFLGGRQPLNPPWLNPSITNYVPDNPPFGHFARTPTFAQILRMWDPPPPEAYQGRQRGDRRDLAAILESLPIPVNASGWVYHYSGVLVPDSYLVAANDSGFAVFDNYVWSPVAQGVYEAPGISLAKRSLIRAWATLVQVLGPGAAGKIAPQLQLRYSTSATSDPAMWGSSSSLMWNVDPSTLMWAGLSDWVGLPAKATLRTDYVQIRVVNDFTQGLPIFQAFTPVIDQPVISDSSLYSPNGPNVAVARGGTRVNFNTADFLNPPHVDAVFVSATGDTSGTATATAIDNTGFTLHVFDTIGNDVGGVAGWRAST